MTVHELTTFSISIISLGVSALVAWLTLLRSGTIRMTQPTSIYLGPDGPTGEGGPKVVIRTLLYASAHSGRIIESMYVKLRRGESLQTFNIWVLGEKELDRGSGLYVNRQGVTSGHHFLLPNDGTGFDFLAGEYQLSIYANIVGKKRPLMLYNLKVVLKDTDAAAIKLGHTGVFFDWGPDSRQYHPHVMNLWDRALKKAVAKETAAMLFPSAFGSKERS